MQNSLGYDHQSFRPESAFCFSIPHRHAMQLRIRKLNLYHNFEIRYTVVHHKIKLKHRKIWFAHNTCISWKKNHSEIVQRTLKLYCALYGISEGLRFGKGTLSKNPNDWLNCCLFLNKLLIRRMAHWRVCKLQSITFNVFSDTGTARHKAHFSSLRSNVLLSQYGRSIGNSCTIATATKLAALVEAVTVYGLGRGPI